MWFPSGLSRIVVIFWCSNWRSEEDEDFAVNLGLLEVLQSVWLLSLACDEVNMLRPDDGPIFIADPTASDRGCLILRIALNPTANHRATVVPELWVRRLRSNLKSEVEHGHFTGPVFARPQGRRTRNALA